MGLQVTEKQTVSVATKGSFGYRCKMNAEQFSKTVDRLTVEHLRILVKHLAAFNHGPDFVKYGLSTEVLRFIFGNRWTNENVFVMHKDIQGHNIAGRKFLRTDAEKSGVGPLHQQQVLQLAEHSYNLQGIEGFQDRVARMQRDDLESAFGEFACAGFFASPALKFQFVDPTGKRGSDYEAELTTPAQRLLCCEFKAKAEGTPLTKATLTSTFEKARQQLPKDKAGLIALALPITWLDQPGLWPLVGAAVESTFKRSGRVVAVVCVCESLQPVGEATIFVLQNRTYLNRNSRFFSEDIEKLSREIGRRNNPGWLQFTRFVYSEIGKPHS